VTYGVVGLDEGVVDGDDRDVGVLKGISEDDTTNTAETIDSNLYGGHGCCIGGQRAEVFLVGGAEGQEGSQEQEELSQGVLTMID
jgi:hypothetical protein